jgi:hypothetical protein
MSDTIVEELSPKVVVDFGNFSKNKKATKNKAKSGEFNSFSHITDLVKEYKRTDSNDDLLVILQAISGIINSYSLLFVPGSVTQQIFITPYMKRFLRMFFSESEKSRFDLEIYNIVIARIRWDMRHHTYEDVYAHVLFEMISTIKKCRIIGTCDIFYYFQHVLKYKLHNYVLKQSKDVFQQKVNIEPEESDDADTAESIIDRLSQTEDDFEDRALENIFYNDVDLSILLEDTYIWRYFSYYEKYIIYLKYGLSTIDNKPTKNNVILSIIKHETKEELEERLDDILYKMELLASESN